MTTATDSFFSGLRHPGPDGPPVALDGALAEALRGEFTPKFLATRDTEGSPNVVPIISIQPYDRERLIFGNFLMWKTERNLRADPRVSVALFTKDLFAATLRGVFEGFQKTGEFVDIVNSSSHMRYNAYMGVRSAGSIRITGISAPLRFSKGGILLAALGSRLRGLRLGRAGTGNRLLKPVVAQRFSRLAAVKVIAFLDRQGHPVAVPVRALAPVRPDVLLFPRKPVEAWLADLREGAPVAASVITAEPVAFQVKGTFRSAGSGWGTIQIEKVYHASPPYVGKAIEHQP